MRRLSTAASAVASTQKELAKLLADAQSEASGGQQQRRRRRLRLASSSEEVKEDEEQHWSAIAAAVEAQEARSEEDGVEAVRALTGFSQDNQFVELTRKLSEALERVDTLEQALEESHAARDAAVRRAADLEKATQGLRALMLEAMRDTEQSKHRMRRAQAFYDQLGGVANGGAQELLRLSEPPAHFEAFKVEASHATELETTKARLKQASIDIVKLQTRLEKMSEEKIRARKDRAKRQRDLEQLLSSKHKQVLGAVRRVHYLLQQNEQYQTEARKKDAYVARLETKLLELSRQLNQPSRQAAHPAPATATSTSRPLAVSLVSASTTNSHAPSVATPRTRSSSRRSPPASANVNWDAVFRQATLARGPVRDPAPAPRPPTARSNASSRITTEDTLMDRLSQWTTRPASCALETDPEHRASGSGSTRTSGPLDSDKHAQASGSGTRRVAGLRSRRPATPQTATTKAPSPSSSSSSSSSSSASGAGRGPSSASSAASTVSSVSSAPSPQSAALRTAVSAPFEPSERSVREGPLAAELPGSPPSAPSPKPLATAAGQVRPRLARAGSESSAGIVSQMAADLVADSRKTFEQLLAEQDLASTHHGADGIDVADDDIVDAILGRDDEANANEIHQRDDDDDDDDDDDSLQDAWLDKLGASGF